MLVKEMKTRNIETLGPDSTLKVAEKMNESEVKRLPVLSNNNLIGILTIGDFAKRGSRKAVIRAFSGKDYPKQ